MKKNWLIMLAVAMMGSFVVACSSDNNTDEVVTPPTNNTQTTQGKQVVLTGSFGARSSALDESRGTRAVDSQGKVTWQSTDKFSLSYYSNTIGDYTKVEVGLDSILNNHDAFFTVTLDDPDLDKDMTFIYPASAANDADNGRSYKKAELFTEQKGTLADVSAKWDIAMAKVKATYYPSESVVRHATLDNIHLENQLCICELNLKLNSSNARGNKLTINAGEDTYTVTPSGLTTKFVVALIPNPDAAKNFVFEVGTNKKNLQYTYYGKDLPAVAATETAALGKFVTADGKVWVRDGEKDVVYKRKSNGVILLPNKYYKVDLDVHNDATVDPIGIIAWLGTNPDLTCGKNHGLVMAIREEISEKAWAREGFGDETFEAFFDNGNVESISDCLSKYVNGSYYSGQLAQEHGGLVSHEHPVFAEIEDYQGDYPFTIANTGNWFIPSIAQWLAVLGSEGLGKFSGAWGWDDAYTAGSGTVYTELSNALTENYMIRDNLTYWTSTQADDFSAVYVSFSAANGIKVYIEEKYKKNNVAARPFFAF